METILLFEPDPAKLIALALILRSFGYEVLEASSRGQAWRLCCEHHGAVHLLMTNAARDSTSASEFIARLQLACPQITALFVTDTSTSKLADNQPCCEWASIQKPFRANVLAATIRELLDRPKATASSPLS